VLEEGGIEGAWLNESQATANPEVGELDAQHGVIAELAPEAFAAQGARIARVALSGAGK
jgi:hypothetical protein